MKPIDLSPDKFVPKLLGSARETRLCLLDSCNADHPGSTKLIAGIEPTEILNLSGDAAPTLAALDRLLAGERPVVFTLSYEFGRKLQLRKCSAAKTGGEPDVYAAVFDGLLVHDYSSGSTVTTGNAKRFEDIFAEKHVETRDRKAGRPHVRSNFTTTEYISRVEEIKELIRRGDTYQTNLTQQLMVDLPASFSLHDAFLRLRKHNPAPFAAYIERDESTVISASPERFFKTNGSDIEASPIKGTRRRGANAAEDACLREELLHSEKDRAENIMIVDLLRNDLGRVCEYTSVEVDELCTLQELPSLFHLISTIKGKLRSQTRPSDVIRALFPCGSITGAPKIRTMEIIDRLESAQRGLSMGGIGLYIPAGWHGGDKKLDLSVAIRTMVIRDGRAVFNVGGGITIDSDPIQEYDESRLKACALLDALGVHDPR